MTLAPYRLFVVEDDPHTRKRLVALAEQDDRLKVVGEAGDLAGALQMMAVVQACDAALIDLGLPDGDGADLIQQLSALPDGPCTLVISVFGDERHVVRAIEAGASGYLLKDSDEISLADAIVRTILGESPINPAIARHLLRRFQQPTNNDITPPSPITPRETEVLTLIARGYSNAEIAKVLELATNTVTSHTKSIYRKLAVGSRSEAVFEATQMGLINMRRDDGS